MSDLYNKDDLNKYEDQYSEEGFVSKVSRFAKKAGLNTIYYALLLFQFLVSKEEKFPFNKALIIGALGYFISPFDLIPDLIPGTGFFDDVGFLLLVLNQIKSYLTDDMKEKAKKNLHDYFDFTDDELDDAYR